MVLCRTGSVSPVQLCVLRPEPRYTAGVRAGVGLQALWGRSVLALGVEGEVIAANSV